MSDSVYDIAIIGAGTAGLTAAIYACRANKSVIVFEASAPGGQILSTSQIENYPAAPNISGPEFSSTLFNQASELGAKFEFAKVSAISKTNSLLTIEADSSSFKSRSLIIATGTAHRPLNLKHSEQLIGHGLSYCATCDGPFFKNQDLAVYGGGNTAFMSALFLSGFAKSVALINHTDHFFAENTLVEKLKSQPNVSIYNSAEITALNLDPSHRFLSSIEIKQANKQFNLPVTGLFVAIGRIPANDFASNIVKLDQDGYIIADENCTTDQPNVFVAGDNRTKTLRQLVTAAADGATAATAAVNYLNSK